MLAFLWSVIRGVLMLLLKTLSSFASESFSITFGLVA